MTLWIWLRCNVLDKCMNKCTIHTCIEDKSAACLELRLKENRAWRGGQTAQCLLWQLQGPNGFRGGWQVVDLWPIWRLLCRVEPHSPAKSAKGARRSVPLWSPLRVLVFTAKGEHRGLLKPWLGVSVDSHTQPTSVSLFALVFFMNH